MKYLVLECHTGYAVVLDEEGRFLKVANMHYEVGQTVDEVVEMQIPQQESEPVKKKNFKWMYSITAVAACLILVAVFALRGIQAPYASVYMTINPQVRIDVNRNDTVVDVEGVNDDGRKLVSDYVYKEKNLDLVMDELVDLAIEMGYLHEGGKITIDLDSDDAEWTVAHEDTLSEHLNEYLTDKISVTIKIDDKVSGNTQIDIPTEQPTQVPAPKPTSTPVISGGDTDYSDTDYGTDYSEPTKTPTPKPASTPVTNGDSGYSDGQTDYGDNSYDDSAYGDTDDDNDDD